MIGSRKASKANAAASAADAAVAKKNAELVGLRIDDAIFRGRRTQQDIVEEGAATVGRNRANMAGSGKLDLSFGSPLDTIYNTIMDFQRERATAERNTGNEILDLERERVNYTARAQGSAAAASAQRSAWGVTALGQIANNIGTGIQPGGAYASLIR